MPSSAPSTSLSSSIREQLARTAERLFGLHGLDGVSLRQIGQATGLGNNSAVQYHFGTRDGLVLAAIELRLPYIRERRRLLAAEARPGDLRAAVESYLRPMVELAEADDSYHAMFIQQLQGYGIAEHPFTRLADVTAAHRAFMTSVGELLPHLPEPIRAVRVGQAAAMCLHASADRERARHHGARMLPFGLHVSELFDGLVGFLLAPTSEATLAALESSLPTLPKRALVP